MNPRIHSKITAVGITAGLMGCSTQPGFQTSKLSNHTGSQITWNGENTTLTPAVELKSGSPLPETMMVGLNMSAETLKGAGEVTLISVLPSLDTPVCDIQTHKLSESKKLDPRVKRITISRDLPYAQRRFAEKSKLNNVLYLSDYRWGAFGSATGLVVSRNNLLARAIIVVDKSGVIRHLQVVPEITQLPDMEAAFAAANKLLN